MMEVHCPNCGTALEDEQPQCSNCGTIQDSFVYKSRVAAAALAMFTGIFGGHRFYLGQWWGIFYFLFFWTYIPWLVSFVEAIVFLATRQKHWNAKYNQSISTGSERGTVLVVFACIFPVMMFIGIIAAIAIPAYQGYISRAEFSSVHQIAGQVVVGVESYAYEHQHWPTHIIQLGEFEPELGEHIDAVDLKSGTIYITPASQLGVSGQIIYTASITDDGIINWDCTDSTVAPQYLPSDCKVYD